MRDALVSGVAQFLEDVRREPDREALVHERLGENARTLRALERFCSRRLASRSSTVFQQVAYGGQIRAHGGLGQRLVMAHADDRPSATRSSSGPTASLRVRRSTPDLPHRVADGALPAALAHVDHDRPAGAAPALASPVGEARGLSGAGRLFTILSHSTAATALGALQPLLRMVTAWLPRCHQRPPRTCQQVRVSAGSSLQRRGPCPRAARARRSGRHVSVPLRGLQRGPEI